MEPHQKVVVSGFLYKDGKCFVAKRSDAEKFLPNYWELVGGKVEFSEELPAALAREFKEETNLQIEVGQPYWTFSYLSQNGNRQSVEIVFLVTLVHSNQEPVLDPSHSEYKWVEKEEIETMQFSPEAKDSIKKGFAQIEAALRQTGIQ